MKNYKIMIAFIFIIGCTSASTYNNLSAPNTGTNYLPDIELADLDGKTYKFPADFETDKCLLVFGFAHEQKDIVAKWYDELKLIGKEKRLSCIYKVPVIDKSNIAIRMMARNGMRMGTADPDMRKATLTLFVDKENFAKTLGIDDTNTPGILLISKSGDIIWKNTGAVNREKVSELLQVLN